MTKLGGLLVSLAVLAAGSMVIAVHAEEGFERCDGPSLEEQARCLYETGSEAGRLAEAATLLQELAAAHPDEGWPIFYTANALWGLDPAAAQQQYLVAAERFAAEGEASAEIRTRINLSTMLGFGQRFADAESQIEAAEQALSSSNDPVDKASLDLGLARLLMLKGEDLETADGLLQEAERIFFGRSEVSFYMRRECLRSLGQVTFDLGLYRRARAYFERSLELALASGNRAEQASAAYDRTEAWMADELPNESRRQEALEQMRENLALAEEVGNRAAELDSRRQIAQLVGGSEAVVHLERCLAPGEDFVGIERIRRLCLLTLASHRLEEDGDEVEARELLAQAYAAGLESDDPWTLLLGWSPMLQVLWETAPADQALATAESVLSAIEGLRHAQAGVARDRLLSTWSGAYYWLSGRLLELAETDPGGDELSRAFAVIERHRALHLREILERDQPTTTDALPADLAADREDLQRRMTSVYRRLLDPDLDAAERAQWLDELEKLELEEVELEHQIAALAPLRASLPPPPDDLLEQVAASLGEDEALLSFQLASWQGYDRRFAGGAWVLAVTRDGARVYRLPERAGMESRVKLVLGSDWDEDDGRALARLYRDLLEAAVDQLPPGVGRLILVPDGLLHLLPFAALRPSPDDPPLAQRFELATVPSAELWLHWKNGTPPDGAATALVMAAPELAAPRQGSSRDRAWALASGEALGELRYARREGERVVAHLAGASDLLAGTEASEQSLKSTDLSRYGVLHFATHAVVHGERPWRSAVVLAAGSDNEDGLLRPAEIGKLPLRDKVVVLSTCDSAVGEVLRGEGVISLARAFFEAGARAVVATIRRLPDKEGAEFFDEFYCHLSHGLSLSGALAATQRHWIEKGQPAAVWASVVVLGNGDLVLAPGGGKTDCRPWDAGRAVPLHPAAFAAGLVALSALFAVTLRRRRG